MSHAPSDLEAAAAAIAGAQQVVALTGAGISAESGLATFRDPLDGLWAKYDPTELATPEAFARDPDLVTRWYDMRRTRCLAASPNAGHEALCRLATRMDAESRQFTLLTQNVDRLHQRAGSTDVVELHGTLVEWHCATCNAPAIDLPDPLPSTPLPCDCGGLFRPGVVWFGESLPQDAIEAAYSAIQSCDVFLSIGTSALVQPAASFVHIVAQRGGMTIEVNRDPTPISSLVTWSLQGSAGELLPQLVDAATNRGA